MYLGTFSIQLALAFPFLGLLWRSQVKTHTPRLILSCFCLCGETRSQQHPVAPCKSHPLMLQEPIYGIPVLREETRVYCFAQLFATVSFQTGNPPVGLCRILAIK